MENSVKKDLKVGDKVVVNSLHTFDIKEIDRETKTLFIVGNIKFNKTTLNERSWDTWPPRSIKKATDEDFAEFERNKLVEFLTDCDFRYTPLSKLRAIYNILV